VPTKVGTYQSRVLPGVKPADGACRSRSAPTSARTQRIQISSKAPV